jgi:hypothetical protein
MPHLMDSHFPTKEIEVGSTPTWGATFNGRFRWVGRQLALKVRGIRKGEGSTP